MIRSSSLSLNFATQYKLDTLNTIFDEYSRVVNLYIEEYKNKKQLPKFTKLKLDTWISARLQQCAGKQALENIRSTRKKESDIRYKRFQKV